MSDKVELFQNLRGVAPKELIDFLSMVVSFFPAEFRFRLREVLSVVPPEGGNMEKVLELIRHQWRDIQFQKWIKIAMVGPANTGKSSLLRTIQSEETQTVAPVFQVVETPGLDEFLGFGSRKVAPAELEEADVLLLVLDGQYGTSDSTEEMVSRLKGLGKPILVVLNKIDLVDDKHAAVRAARRCLRLNVTAVSSQTPRTIDRVFDALVATDSRTLHPLTQSFPHYRKAICRGIVTQASVASGLIGGLQIPVSDMLPLTAIQTGMLLKIARSFGHQLGWSRGRELIPMLVGGFLVRQGTSKLRRRYPRHKRLIGVSAAGLWTYGLGRAAVSYFEDYAEIFEASDDEPQLLEFQAVTDPS
jgi:GTP-binding protein Era